MKYKMRKNNKQKKLKKQLADYTHGADKEQRENVKITSELYPELTIAEAYLVQEELVRQKLAEGKKIVGPKMGITSEAKMKQMDVDNPIYGYVFDNMVVEEGDSIAVSDRKST